MIEYEFWLLDRWHEACIKADDMEALDILNTLANIHQTDIKEIASITYSYTTSHDEQLMIEYLQECGLV